MVTNKNFWAGKTVLITGHTGFKGSWLSLWLSRLSARVIGYSLPPPTQPNLFDVSEVSGSVQSIVGDVRDYESLRSVIELYRPVIVFHMAAQSLVRHSYLNPVETYETNVMGTVNLFESIRSVEGVKVIVNVTSDKCYENREWVWGYRENEPMGGYDPYSSSKGCAELVTSAYRSSFFNSNCFEQHGVALASVRAGNVIGGGDWAEDRLIPDVMRAFMTGETVLVRNPLAIRPWQHVLAPLHGYLTLAEKMWGSGANYSESWNFGPDDSDVKPVSWVVEFLANAWGQKASWALDKGVQPHEAHYLKLDCSKAKTQLGWHPYWGLENALNSVVEWYRGYQNREDIRTLTLNQIARYEAALSS